MLPQRDPPLSSFRTCGSNAEFFLPIRADLKHVLGTLRERLQAGRLRCQLVVFGEGEGCREKSKDEVKRQLLRDSRPAVTKHKLCQSVRFFLLRCESTLLAVNSWISFLRVNSEGISRRRLLTEDMWKRRHSNSRSAPGLVDGHPVGKPHRPKHMPSEAIITGASRCERFASEGGELRKPWVLRLVCSVWPPVRASVRVGDFIFPCLQRSDLICRLRSVGGYLEWPDADKLGAYSLRRAAARA